MPNSYARTDASVRTIVLCFIVAMLEGLDLQAVGVAAPAMATTFALSPAALGWVFSAGLFGLLPGAVFGGWLADRFGRKQVLIAAVMLFGLFSLLTAHSATYEQVLAARFITGLGMGAAMPILIALSSEVSTPGLRNLAISLTYCGVPLGGAIAALIGMFSIGGDWRLVFYVGGFAPLVIAALLMLWLPNVHAVQGRSLALGTITLELLGKRRGTSTLLLWGACFCTLTILYMLLNWLPTLLMGRGLTRLDTSLIQVLFNVGGVAGSLVAGWLMDKGKSLLAVLLAYLGMFAALAALGFVEQTAGLYAAGLAAGACAVGAQLILYALAPRIYPTHVRATCVGVAVAVGRLGSMSGPLAAGQLLAAGVGVSGLLLAVSPLVAIAAGSAVVLLRRSA